MNKHTAGPWKYRDGACDIITENKWIADIKWLSPEDDANGLLIAAAPNLLEALKETKSELARAFSWMKENGKMSEVIATQRQATLDKAREVIELAEGRP